MNANEVLVGQCGDAVEAYIENLFDVKLEPVIQRFDFQKVV